MPGAIGPLTGHGHDPIGHLAQLAQILLGRQRDALPALGIARLIKDEHSCRMWTQRRVRLPQLQPLTIDRLGIPRSIMHEMLQLLPIGTRDEGCQLDPRLVVLPWQQQSNELVAERLPLLPAWEEGIKGSTELINRLGGRSRRFARGGHRNTSHPKQNPR